MKNVEQIREMYPEGTLIELEEMKGEPQMPSGMKGKVRFVDDMGQIHMRWENGSSLALNIEEDSFNKVEPTEKISVLLISPKEYPKVIEIENTLESMQKVVEGNIEEYMPFDDEVAIVCNEEGKYNGMLPNRAIYSDDKEMQDIIFGQFFVCYAPIESENFMSLTDDMIEKYSEKFKNPERFFRKGNEIVAVPFNPKAVEQER